MLFHLRDVSSTEFRSLSSSVSYPSPAFTPIPSSVSNSSTSKPSSIEVPTHTKSTSSPPTFSTVPFSPPPQPSVSQHQPSSSSPPSRFSLSSSASPFPTSPRTSNAGSGTFSSDTSAASPGISNVGSGSTSGPTSPSDIQAYLTGHNSVRVEHSAAPLTYSQDLAAKAQQWANGCVFEHSGGKLGTFGENLAAGTGDSYGISQAIKSWTDEACTCSVLLL